MARLSLNSPGIPIPNVRMADIVGRVAVDESAGEMTFRVDVLLAGALPYVSFACSVKNGEVIGVRAKATPTGPLDAVEEVRLTTVDNAAIATAFTDCYADFKTAGGAGGKVGLMTRLRTLNVLLPTFVGTVA